MTNALRHGHARHVKVTLAGGDEGVALTLVDDGDGMPAEASGGHGHHGLRWLAERVEGLGGRFHIGPAAQRGVELRIELPPSAVVGAAA